MRPNIIAAVFAFALLLGGCAHFPTEDWSARVSHSQTIDVEAPGEHAVGWGRTIVHPAAYEDLGPSNRPGPYTLDTGDVLRVFVYGEPNLSRLYTVDSEGRIAVPLIGHVRARGRTTRSLTQAITHRLGTRYVRDPKVTVDINRSRPFFILGEVRSAGQYPFAGGITVEAAIAIAGGYSERANQQVIRITRRVNGNSEDYDVTPDFYVRPGDTIYVNERMF